MLIDNVLVPGIVVPLVATALALFLLELLHRRWQRPWRGAAGVAVAAGFLAAFVAVSGWPRWVPVEATQRLFFLVAGASVASWLVARAPNRWVLLAVEVGTVALLLALVLQTQLEHSWEPQQAILWLGGLALATLAVTRAIGTSLTHGDRGIAPFVRMGVVAGVAVLLGLSDSFRLALLGGGLACATAMVDLVVLRGRARWDRADALVVAISLQGLMMTSYFYAGLTPWSALLALLALLALSLSGSKSRALRLAPLLPIALAIALALANLLSAEDPYDDYYAAPDSPVADLPGVGTASIRAR
jgi:hypothetical protein